MTNSNNSQSSDRLTPNIARAPDGKYRWAYDLSLWKNPTILFMLWKIFGGIFAGIWAFLLVLGWDNMPEHFFSISKVFGLLILFMFGLIVVAYAVYALIMGGKYCVLFEMDETRIVHMQAPEQFKKARKLGAFTSGMGMAAGNMQVMIIGATGSSRQGMTSHFDKVKSIKVYPRRGVIKVNEMLNKNQVYADKEDFAAVLDFIVRHCPQARVKGWSR